MQQTDFIQQSSARLLRWLTLREFRPNLLITCGDARIEAITKHLMTWCAPPFHACPLPGPLWLPPATAGTLVLERVAALTLRQQIELYDWISAGRGHVQIVSMTSVPLWPLVEDGHFLEGLFFRLNVVCLEARQAAGRESTWSEDLDLFDLDAIDSVSTWQPCTMRRELRRS